jgi:hypothetical protein
LQQSDTNARSEINEQEEEMERLDVEDFDEEKRAVRELNTYLAALDILGARDVEDNQKLKQRFNQKLSDIQSGDIGECF